MGVFGFLCFFQASMRWKKAINLHLVFFSSAVISQHDDGLTATSNIGKKSTYVFHSSLLLRRLLTKLNFFQTSHNKFIHPIGHPHGWYEILKPQDLYSICPIALKSDRHHNSSITTALLSNFKTIQSFYLPISQLREFARSYDKTSNVICRTDSRLVPSQWEMSICKWILEDTKNQGAESI